MIAQRLLQSAGHRFNHIVHQCDRSLGRKLYHTTNPLSQALRGRGLTVLGQALKGFSGKRREGKCFYELQEKGCTQLPLLHDADLIRLVCKKFDVLIEDDRHSVARGAGPRELWENGQYGRDLIDPLRSIPEIRHLISDDIIEFFQDYLGTYVRVNRPNAFRNRHIPQQEIQALAETGAEIYANWWHFDNRQTAFFTCWIPLRDINIEDGPTHVLSPERSKKMVKAGYGGRSSYNIPADVLDDENHIQYLTGPAGSKLLFAPAICLHRAGIPQKNRFRDTALFYIEPALKRQSPNWRDKL